MIQIPIGFITIFLIVLVPVYVFVLAALLGKPRMPKITAFVLLLPATLIIIAVIVVWIMGYFLSFIVPYY